MEIPTKSLEHGFSVPEYGLGLWQMGGGRWQRDEVNDGQDIEAIRFAIEAGVTHIDTAQSYGAGHSEELLGKAIEGYDRSKLFIATKFSGRFGRSNDLRDALHGSLERIGTDYIDLYQAHYYPPEGIQIAETMQTLDELVAEGRIRHIGVCNMTPRRFDEAQRYSDNKIVTNQVHYSARTREPERLGVLQHAQQNEVMLVAWRPMEYGKLPGREFLEQIGNNYGATPAQVAIAWLLRQANVVTLVKTSNPIHLRENLGALSLKLSEADVNHIRDNFPIQDPVSAEMPLDYAAGILP